MYYDAHTHLNDPKLCDNWEFYLRNFIDSWGRWMCIVWVDEDRNTRWLNIVKTVRNQLFSQEKEKTYLQNLEDSLFIKCTIWYHPSEICFGKIQDFDLTDKMIKLKTSYRDDPDVIVGIWEFGIDTHYEGWYETVNLQKKFMALHMDLAQELNLPVIIHSREDFKSTFDVARNYKDLKIYFHCWWYGQEEVKQIQKYFNNVWIWYAWNITYSKAEIIRQSFKVTDKSSMIIETDAPYLSPQLKRWQVNEPVNVIDIYKYCSELLWINLTDYQEIIKQNFFKLYVG